MPAWQSAFWNLREEAANVADYTHCMTRLRITPVDKEKADIDSIKALEGVIGVVEAETLQIILGTGVVQHVSDEFGESSQKSGSL